LQDLQEQLLRLVQLVLPIPQAATQLLLVPLLCWLPVLQLLLVQLLLQAPLSAWCQTLQQGSQEQQPLACLLPQQLLPLLHPCCLLEEARLLQLQELLQALPLQVLLLLLLPLPLQQLLLDQALVVLALAAQAASLLLRERCQK
jgi:hypothetical protein